MKETLQDSSFSRPDEGGDGLPGSSQDSQQHTTQSVEPQPQQNQPRQEPHLEKSIEGDQTHSSGPIEGLASEASDQPLKHSEPKPSESMQNGPLQKVTEPDADHTVTYVEPADRNEISAFENVNEHEQTVISQRPVAAPEEFYRSMPLAELAAMLEGRHLDHFSVEQMIGGGGMGAVFRGLDMRLDRVVAVKVIPASKRDPETLRRFRLEAQAAARLDHPNIARVYYVGEAEQWNYIVFEFIDGINVRDLVERSGVLSVDDAVYYTRQVAEALQHAQDRDVVHRDIKPSNVLVTAGGIAKVVDMGLARDTSMDKSTADATASGMTLGTFDYIAPEQARNPRDADVRSDIYSLGCTLFYMLTGSPPFPDGTALQKLLNHGSQPPPDPRSWRGDLSDELVEIIKKMMAKKPGERYQRPEELVNDLVLLAEYEHLPRTLSPGTLMLNPLVSQRSLLESNLPWLVALAFLTGSTLWLQSFDSFSKGLTLPEIKLKQPVAPVSLGPQGQGTVLPRESVLPSSPLPGSSYPGPLFPSPAFPSPAFPSPAFPGPLIQGAGANPESLDGRKMENATGAPGDSNAKSVDSAGLLPREASNEPDTTKVDPIASANVESTTTAGDETTDSIVSELPDWNGSGSGDERSLGARPLIVSSRRPLGLESVFWQPSLEEAIKASKPGQPIEIRGEIVINSQLSLSAAELGLNNVSLMGGKSTPGVLVIAPSLFESTAFESGVESGNSLVAAIQLKAVELTLDNIAVRFDLGREAVRTNRNVFGLTAGASLTLINSSVSVNGTWPEETSIVEIVEDDLVAMGENDSDSGALVAFRNSLLRGGANAVAINSNRPAKRRAIEIGFENALLALDGYAVSLDSDEDTQLPSSFVKVLCSRSTILARRGFALMQYTSERPTLGINRVSKSSLFWSTKGIPHITISSQSTALTENPNLLLLQGADNAYDESSMTLVAQSLFAYSAGGADDAGSGKNLKSYSFNQAQSEGWWIERGTERLIRWRTPVDQAEPFYSAKPSDFRIKESMFSPGFQSDYQLAPQLGAE